MNQYTTTFFAACPNNGVRITYRLHITTGQVIPVEKILQEVSEIRSGFHEEIADVLAGNLGGCQVIEADHHGVTIKTTRPHIAHWSRKE